MFVESIKFQRTDYNVPYRFIFLYGIALIFSGLVYITTFGKISTNAHVVASLKMARWEYNNKKD